MTKSAYISTRIEPKLKKSAEGILSKLGVTTTEAITIFLQQVVLRKGLPFDVRLPSAETRAAFAEIDAGDGERFEGSTKDMFAQLLKPASKRKG